MYLITIATVAIASVSISFLLLKLHKVKRDGIAKVADLTQLMLLQLDTISCQVELEEAIEQFQDLQWQHPISLQLQEQLLNWEKYAYLREFMTSRIKMRTEPLKAEKPTLGQHLELVNIVRSNS